MAYLRALRPHHWLKNLLILAPALAGHVLTPDRLIAALPALTAFCLAASAGYLLNDWRDLACDRRHESKKGRPLASGELTPTEAVALAAGLVALAAALGWRRRRLSPRCWPATPCSAPAILWGSSG